MTSEQIAELRKGYEERSRDDLDAEADEVLKLLDEREALLEALKEAQRIIDGEVCSTDEHGVDCKNLLAVIAKAES